MATLVVLILRYVLAPLTTINGLAFNFVLALIQINVFLAVFNLLPIPPLDGFGVLFGLSPRPLKITLLPLLRYGPLILLLVLFLPQTQEYLSVYLNTGASIILRLLGGLSRGL
jgi:Zn-dependent protease